MVVHNRTFVKYFYFFLENQKTHENIVLNTSLPMKYQKIIKRQSDMENAIYMARDAIELKCVGYEDDGREVNPPSKISDLDVKNCTFYEDGETIISLVDIDSTAYRRKIDTKAVHKNVTIPSWLNYEAEHAGINISRILQEALMNKLGVQQKY